MRFHLFEFTDLPWYPQVFRSIQTDYLQFVTSLGSGHKNLIPLFKNAMQHAGTTEMVDLCSGGGGPWINLQEEFKQAGLSVHVRLTDKYPHPEAIQKWAEVSRKGIEYLAEPVDALNVPSHLKGMRTLFEGFHHFKPKYARSILLDAAEKRIAIGICEASIKPPLGILFLLLSPIMTLVSYLLLTPFITPHTFSRIFWTYLVPIVPLATCWDGVISLLRVYSPQELKALTESIQVNEYTWEIGQAPIGAPGLAFTYLIGYPV
jgi:hypothetical protein